ncbi:hypothetical protein F4604DRAFT_1927661 [Suillus subluteus]|nr:hypothetical protein F4604DRAFT_1927661 [Suillus subluteus]
MGYMHLQRLKSLHQHLLFSSDGNDTESLRNLKLLKVKYVPNSPEDCSSLMRPKATNSTSKIGEEEIESGDRHSCIRKLHKRPKTKNSFILDMAKVGDDDEEEEVGEEEEEGEEGEEGYGDGTSVGSAKVMRLARPLATQKLAATFDDMATRFEQNQHCSSQGCENATHGVPEARMYLVHVQRTTTEYVASHLRKKGFPMTISAWPAGQLYMVVDSPKTVAKSLPLSLYLAVKQYTLITEEEHGAVERSQSEFPNPAWVRVKNGPYRGNTVLVFEQLPNDIVAVLIVSRDMPYAMPGRTQALVERSRLPKNKTVSDVLHGDQVVGWKFLELVASPHINDISLHLESGWDKIFMKETVIAFLMQFLCAGDSVRVVTGSLRGELGKIVSTDHTVGSVCLESAFDGHITEVEVPLRDIEHVFRVGDTDIFTLNNVELSSISVPAAMVQWTDITKTIQYMKERGYDIRPGDVVTVVHGPEYEAKGVVQCVDFPNAHLTLLCEGDHSLINVPIGFVMKVRNTDLDHFKKEIGKEVFIISGDQKGSRGTLHSVGLETCIVAVYGQKRIELKLYEVATRYGVRLNGAMLEGPDMASFCEMRKRSFLAPPPHSITPPVETLPSSSSASMTGPIPSSSNVWSSWSAHPGGVDAAQDPLSSVQPSSSTFQLWIVDKNDTQDSNDATAEKLRDSAIMDPFCTSNGAGAAMKHYHIPTRYLSPAPPQKKNQECLILDGPHCGLIRTLVSCSAKHANVKINITPMAAITLRFDQICLVEPI